jgi:hypothetical protein
MPTPSQSRPHPRGLTLADHEALVVRVRRVVADLLTLRTTVKAGVGEHGEPYEAADAAVGDVRRLSLALAEILPGADADPQTAGELRALYLTAGAEPHDRGHGSSLQGSTLHHPNGRRPLGREG